MKKRSAIDRLDSFGEDTVLGLSVKTLVAMGITVATMVSMYMTLQAEVNIAKELPLPVVSRTEYELKEELVREAVMETKEDISEIKDQMTRIEDRLYELNVGKR
jgi:hypothetical protein|tara:strand:- start:1928 stop:2239 length:312 start_codon:yes stop_codon:yes gene_type:complete